MRRTIKAWGRHNSPNRVTVNVGLLPNQFEHVASHARNKEISFSAMMQEIVDHYITTCLSTN
jgi:hypothetical protein